VGKFFELLSQFDPEELYALGRRFSAFGDSYDGNIPRGASGLDFHWESSSKSNYPSYARYAAASTSNESQSGPHSQADSFFIT